MPGPVHFVRLLALAVFLVLVALGLWLLDVRPALVIVGMVVALAIAWTIEWLAWSGLPVSTRAEPFANEPPPPAPAAPPTHAVAPEEPPPAEAAPVPTFVPPAAKEAPPAKASPEPEPEPEPARRRRFFARRSGASGVPAGDEPVPRRTPAEPVRSPSPAPPPATPPRDEPEPSAEPDRRELIRSVPAPPPEPPPPEPPPPEPPSPAAAESPVVAFRAQAPSGPRQWNLWDLERLAREEARRDPSRRDEWSFLILHLRRFASADGLLPSEFDPLVRESFDGLLEGTQRT